MAEKSFKFTGELKNDLTLKLQMKKNRIFVQVYENKTNKPVCLSVIILENVYRVDLELLGEMIKVHINGDELEADFKDPVNGYKLYEGIFSYISVASGSTFDPDLKFSEDFIKVMKSHDFDYTEG